MTATERIHPRDAGGAHRVAPLLDLDPDLGQFLTGTAREAARRQLLVSVRRLAPGAWDTAALTVADPGHVGLLVLDGVIAREVLAADIVSTELLGPGEILRPWEVSPDPSLLRADVRWNILAETRLAVLDRRMASHLSDYPEITSQIIERLTKRSQRLAVTQAISQLNRVDQRLMALFWHMAERWGRMTGDGVLIPLTLSHRMLSQLIGARRPTVSTALGELTRAGELERLPNGTWLLTGEPVGEPARQNLRLIPPRRRFVARELAEEPSQTRISLPHESRQPISGRGARLSEKFEALRADSRRMSQELAGVADTTNELFRRSQELRARREAQLHQDEPDR
jgi:CRP/FNR family transcriptional regulator, cyclic AMP receptor protein